MPVQGLHAHSVMFNQTPTQPSLHAAGKKKPFKVPLRWADRKPVSSQVTLYRVRPDYEFCNIVPGNNQLSNTRQSFVFS